MALATFKLPLNPTNASQTHHHRHQHHPVALPTGHPSRNQPKRRRIRWLQVHRHGPQSLPKQIPRPIRDPGGGPRPLRARAREPQRVAAPAGPTPGDAAGVPGGG